VTRMWPITLVALTAFITTVMIEAVYFAVHAGRWLFDGSEFSFDWTRPLPAAGVATTVVLLVGFLAARLMHLSSTDAPAEFAVKQPVDYRERRAKLRSA
jgi:hypothetical protein